MQLSRLTKQGTAIPSQLRGTRESRLFGSAADGAVFGLGFAVNRILRAMLEALQRQQGKPRIVASIHNVMARICGVDRQTGYQMNCCIGRKQHMAELSQDELARNR